MTTPAITVLQQHVHHMENVARRLMARADALEMVGSQKLAAEIGDIAVDIAASAQNALAAANEELNASVQDSIGQIGETLTAIMKMPAA